MSLLPEINQASAEINKFVAQANIHQTIATVNPAAFTDPADTMLLASRDPVIREVSVGMTGVEAASYTVSGTPPLSLPNSLGEPLKAWSVDLLPYQEGSGDPSPSNVRAIHGTNKLNLFVADSYDPTATPTAVIDVPVLSANQWDEEWEVGTINNTTGKPSPDHSNIRSKNYIPVTPNESYYFYKSTSIAAIRYYWYDVNYGFIDGGMASNEAKTAPSNAYYLKIRTTGTYGDTFNHDFCVNYPSTVTTYNPYNATVYTGTIGSEGGESRWGEVDLGTIEWYAHGSLPNVYTGWGQNIPRWKIIPALGVANALCSEYKLTTSAPGGVDAIDFSIALGTGVSTAIYVHNSAVADIDEFRTAISGVQLAYELETPTTFSVPSVTIPTPSGTASTWAVAQDGTVDSMSVTYVGKA